jgi:NitT/TauT family transport system substrate-binding protein
MAQTVVEGDNTFVENLDPDFVVNDLVDYRFVRAALNKHPEWLASAKANGGDFFNRQEVMEL